MKKCLIKGLVNHDKAKWDYHQIGGSYTNTIVLKSGKRSSYGNANNIHLELSTLPIALVKNGKWNEMGEVGWFGIHNSKNEDKWDAEVIKLIKTLPPKTRITAIDCHI